MIDYEVAEQVETLPKANLRADNRAEAKQLFDAVIADGFKTISSERVLEYLRVL